MGVAAVGLIPKGTELKKAKSKTVTFYVPLDLLEDFERVRKELAYDNKSAFLVAVLTYFIERHDADNKKTKK